MAAIFQNGRHVKVILRNIQDNVRTDGLMGFVLICITIGGYEHEFLQIFLQILNCTKIHISSYFINNFYL